MNLDQYPFYKKARKVWADAQIEQIVKGLHKYEEPFNPHSWTPEELLNHAVMENVDQLHYMVGLYELIKELKIDNYALKQEIEYLNVENERLQRQIPYEPVEDDTLPVLDLNEGESLEDKIKRIINKEVYGL
jgi:hypothetical protein